MPPCEESAAHPCEPAHLFSQRMWGPAPLPPPPLGRQGCPPADIQAKGGKGRRLGMEARAASHLVLRAPALKSNLALTCAAWARTTSASVAMYTQ